MPSITNAPAKTISFALERRKSYQLRVILLNGDDTPVDLTGAVLRMIVKEAEWDDDQYDLNNLLVNSSAVILEPLNGVAQFSLQAAELDADPGNYFYTMVLWTPTKFSGVVLKGDFSLLANAESDSIHYPFTGEALNQELLISLRQPDQITVVTNNMATAPKGDPGPAGDDGLQGPPGDRGASVESMVVEGTDLVTTLSDFTVITIPLPTLEGDPGADGREVLLQVGGGYIQWQYEGDAGWTNLVSLASLTGPTGADGADGIIGADGADGPAGADGDTVDLQVSGGFIQWKHTTDVGWTNLIATATLVGPAGADGADGADGTPGDPTLVADGAIPAAKVAGLVAAIARLNSFPIICKWSGTGWLTLAGDAVPTTATLVRWYDSSNYDTAVDGVDSPTHYNDLDKWFEEPPTP